MSNQEVKLKTLLSTSIQNGYSPICPDEPNGAWVLGLGALSDNGINTDGKKPAPLNDKTVERFLLKHGDFLISRSNTSDKVGRSILYRGEIENCSYPDLMMKFRVDETKIYPEYLEFYLRSPKATKYLQAAASGTSSTMVKINKTAVEKIPVWLPSYDTQVFIANVGKSINDVIKTTERLIEVKERYFDGLIHKLITLNPKRLSWKKYKLSELASMSSGGTPKSGEPKYYSGNIPWVSIADMTSHGKEIFNTARKLTEIGIQNSSAKIFPVGTILYAMYASIGECSIAKIPLATSQAILGIQPKSMLLNEFLYFWLISIKSKKKLLGQQGTQSNLNAQIVKDFVIYLPSLEEQSKIAEILNTAKREIDLLKKLTASYRVQKRGLMQKLFCAEWRVAG